MPRGQLHFKTPLYAFLGQKGLDLAGRKIDDSAVFGLDPHRFTNALVNAQVTVVTDAQVEADNLVHDAKTPA